MRVAIDSYLVTGKTYDELKSLSARFKNCEVKIIFDRRFEIDEENTKIPIRILFKGQSEYVFKAFDKISNILKKNDNISEVDADKISDETGRIEDLDNWKYELNKDRKIIKLRSYVQNTIWRHLVVYSYYYIDGIEYRTSLVGGHNMFNSSALESIIFNPGILYNDLTSMHSMFANCKMLKSLDLSSFDVSNVTDMKNAFLDCKRLQTLDLSNFDTSNVTNMNCMFYDCISLNLLNLTSFNTSNVINMSGMFYNCETLSSLNLLNFNTSKVTNMNSMFGWCAELISLDLTSFDTSIVSDMRTMFNNCRKLKIIKVSRNKWIITDKCKKEYRFNSCGVSEVNYDD